MADLRSFFLTTSTFFSFCVGKFASAVSQRSRRRKRKNKNFFDHVFTGDFKAEPKLRKEATTPDPLERLKPLVSSGNPKKKYKIGKQIGKGESASNGSNSSNSISTDSTSHTNSTSSDSASLITDIINEIAMLRDCRSENIVGYIESFLVKGKELWIVTEYMDGGSLRDVNKEVYMEEGHIAAIIRQHPFVGLIADPNPWVKHLVSEAQEACRERHAS